MEDLPEMEYDGLSETPNRAGNSYRYRSQMDNSEPAPLKFHSVKPSAGVHSPYAGNLIKPELQSDRRRAANMNSAGQGHLSSAKLSDVGSPEQTRLMAQGTVDSAYGIHKSVKSVGFNPADV